MFSVASAAAIAGAIPDPATIAFGEIIFYMEDCSQTTTVTIASLLTDIGTGVSTVLGWVGDVANTIISVPLLSMTLVFFVIGGACGLIGRLLRKS